MTNTYNIDKPLYTKDEINDLPILNYEGEVVLIRTETELEHILPELAKATLLGFDTETRPTFTRGVTMQDPSLIQLATEQKVYLLQISILPFDERIAHILSDENIIKAGIAINDDMNALAKIHPFKPANAVDLAKLANKKGLNAQGLRTITANLLGYRISKGAQCSNWATPSLTHTQIKYATTDAWLGLIIYQQLIKLADSPDYKEPDPKKKKKKKWFAKKKKPIAHSSRE